MEGRKVNKHREYVRELLRKVSNQIGSMEKNGVWARGKEGS